MNTYTHSLQAGRRMSVTDERQKILQNVRLQFAALAIRVYALSNVYTTYNNRAFMHSCMHAHIHSCMHTNIQTYINKRRTNAHKHEHAFVHTLTNIYGYCIFSAGPVGVCSHDFNQMSSFALSHTPTQSLSCALFST